MKNKKIKEKNMPLVAFLISLLLGCAIIVPQIIKGHGIFNLIADFNAQQIPFNKIVNQSLKEGSFLWTWYNELGSNFIGTFSFYNLFSPFNIIGYIFPSGWFEYLVGPILILKYAVAGLTSYLFIQRYVKDKKYAILASLLYAFSGFQLTNTLFYHFHDIVALFPLLLYALDRLVYDDKKTIFGLVVALLAITNWFFFIGEVVFVIIYYIIKLITKSYKFTIKSFISIIIESLLGVMLAAFVLLPSVLFTSSNPRISNGWNATSMLRYSDSVYLELIRSMVLPSQIMSSTAIINSANYSSTELFLPFVGMILMFAYVVKNYKKWDSIFIIILFIFMFTPILNSSFFAFTNTYYSRWFYMPILIFCLASARCLDNKCKLETGIIMNMLLIFTFCLLSYVYINKYNVQQFIFNRNYFLIMIIITILNICLIMIINGLKNWENKFKMLFICVCVFICIWGNYTIYKYKQIDKSSIESYENYLNVNEILNFQKTYRTNSSDSCPYNYGYLTKTSNLKSFNSNINGSSFEFYNSIDYGRGVATIINPSDKKLNDFLGVEYVISCGNDKLEEYGYTFKEKKGTFSIYHNDDYKKFGFNVNKYVSTKEFKKLSYEERIGALNNSVVLTNNQIKKYHSIIANDASYELNEYKFMKNGFNSKIISTNETLAIYTIPYDDGWSATINGKKVDIEKVDNGFIAIKINKGKNEIKFKYFPKGLKVGLMISGVSLIIYIIYVILYMKGNWCCNEKRKQN